MRKNNFLLILFLTVFTLIPFKVSAETIECEDVYIKLQNIKIGESGQKETYAVGGIHFESPEINIKWYESSDNNKYTEMNENSTFNYNTYYKAVLDTSYDELNDNVDENWEICNLSLKIIDNEEDNPIDTKKYTGSSDIEYVFEPIKKYGVTLSLDNMEFEGPTEIAEGNDLIGTLIPKKNYRLPTDDEIRDQVKYLVFINGNSSSKYFDSKTGAIEIPSNDINGHIQIIAVAVELKEVQFDSEQYIYAKDGKENKIELEVNLTDDISLLYINDKPILDDYYSYDKSTGILEIYGDYINNFDDGSYDLRVESKNEYAETTLKIQKVEQVDKIVVDFRNLSNTDLLLEDELSAFEFLSIKKALFCPCASSSLCNNKQKTLFTLDDENNITLANNISNKDNIIYTLTEEEIELYKSDYSYLKVPKTIQIIFANEYKITFDANGGKFGNDEEYIVEDIINFDYSSFNKPTRDGYKFIGFYTKDGKSYYDLENSEAGFEEDTVFYAKWEKIEDNPKTFDEIETSIFMGTISLIGLVGATIYLKKRNKVRA